MAIELLQLLRPFSAIFTGSKIKWRLGECRSLTKLTLSRELVRLVKDRVRNLQAHPTTQPTLKNIMLKNTPIIQNKIDHE